MTLSLRFKRGPATLTAEVQDENGSRFRPAYYEKVSNDSLHPYSWLERRCDAPSMGIGANDNSLPDTLGTEDLRETVFLHSLLLIRWDSEHSSHSHGLSTANSPSTNHLRISTQLQLPKHGAVNCIYTYSDPLSKSSDDFLITCFVIVSGNWSISLLHQYWSHSQAFSASTGLIPRPSPPVLVSFPGLLCQYWSHSQAFSASIWFQYATTILS